jgi:hypothetical protein
MTLADDNGDEEVDYAAAILTTSGADCDFTE